MNEVLKFEAEYASEVMNEIPAGYIDKTICGCGLTTVALENLVHTVIAVPTIYLAQNKAAQYPNERFAGKVLAVWGETSSSKIADYVKNTNWLKIIVTYDSLPKVEYLLDKYKCKLIIDESNELLSRTKLRPEAIHKLFEIAKKHRKTVSFISATPTPLKYMPDWVKKINQIKIEWANTTKTDPILCQSTYPFKSLNHQFLTPLNDNGFLTVNGNKHECITFKKAIIFINSVDQTSKIIREVRIDKKDCGIICGDNFKNDTKINGIKRYSSGELPKFLFITSTGFSGIDLYDKEAMTIVVSNTKRNFQMIDMLTDLKQAISRQRDKQNPHYGKFIYIYNQSVFCKTESELLDEFNCMYERIKDQIKLYELGKRKQIEKSFPFTNEFNLYTIKKKDTFVINEQAFQADKYFILEIRNQYTKGFDIPGFFETSSSIEPIVLPKEVTYKKLVEFFNKNNVNGTIDWGFYSVYKEWIEIIEASNKLYKKVWKDQTYAQLMIRQYGDGYAISKTYFRKIFKLNKRYSRQEVKQLIQKGYDELGIDRIAKYSDLKEIFKNVDEFQSNGTRYMTVVEK